MAAREAKRSKQKCCENSQVQCNNGELPAGFYYAHVPALGLTTHGEGIEGARAAAEDLVKLWLSEKKAAGETVDLPSEIFFSTP